MSMKCPHCGAELGNKKVCAYCGSPITSEIRKEQENFNKQGCPKCGSTNIEFQRETVGARQENNTAQVLYRTIGFCKDCGNTWYPPQDATPKKSRTWLWVLGWIFCFPAPITILLTRNEKMNPIAKYAIIAFAWIVYFVYLFGGS